jgi:hypothetical protein
LNWKIIIVFVVDLKLDGLTSGAFGNGVVGIHMCVATQKPPSILMKLRDKN